MSVTAAAVRRRVLLTVALVACIVVFRGRSLYNPFSDPTAGLYLHIARAWLNGNLPYGTTWDYRPPGYFALYAIAMKAVGAAFARDALAIVALVATALAAGLIARELDPRRSTATAYWAAAFFVMLSPVNDGIAGVAELQISAFAAWAIFLSLKRDSTVGFLAASGLLAGLAIQCKLSAIPLVAVPATLVCLRSSRRLPSLAMFVVGFVLPVVVDVALYASAGRLADLWNANVESTIRRAQSAAGADEFVRNRVNFARQLLALAPQIEFAPFAFSASVNASRIASAGWFLAALLSIVLAGEFYERQFVLLAAPVSILGALGFMRVLAMLKANAKRWAAASTVLVTFALHDYFETNQTLAYTVHRVVLHDSGWRLDQTAELYADLACLPKGPNEVFLLEQSPYLYDMLGDPSPTKYAYSDHLLDPRLSRMAGVDARAELSRILDRKPAYVIDSGLSDFRYGNERVAEIHAAEASAYRLTYRGPRFRIFTSTSADRGGVRPPCTSASTLPIAIQRCGTSLLPTGVSVRKTKTTIATVDVMKPYVRGFVRTAVKCASMKPRRIVAAVDEDVK